MQHPPIPHPHPTPTHTDLIFNCQCCPQDPCKGADPKLQVQPPPPQSPQHTPHTQHRHVCMYARMCARTHTHTRPIQGCWPITDSGHPHPRPIQGCWPFTSSAPPRPPSSHPWPIQGCWPITASAAPLTPLLPPRIHKGELTINCQCSSQDPPPTPDPYRGADP